MIVSLSTISSFAGSTLSSYFAKKGLDLLLPGQTLKDELNNVILASLNEYEAKYPQKNEGKKFPFYYSQRIIDELLRYRVMQTDYNLNDLIVALQFEPNVIIPTQLNIEHFFEIFIEKVNASKTLKKLEIKETFNIEIFNISRKLDDLQRNLENILLTFSSDVENQWQSRLEAYIETINKFMPKTALDLLDKLLKSVHASSKNPSNEFLSLIEYQKAISNSLLVNKDETYKSFILAYRLNQNNIFFKEQAALAYFKIDDLGQAQELSEEILKEYEYNSYAWAVSILITTSEEIDIKIDKVPSLVKRDIVFKKILYHTFTLKRQEDVKKLYDRGLVPSASEYIDLPININTYTEYLFWINLTVAEYNSGFYLNFSCVDSENVLIKSINMLLMKYLKVIKGTEIDKSNEYLYFLYAHTNFHLTNDVKFAVEMKDLFATLSNQYNINLLFTANALQIAGDVTSAIELLEDNNSEHKETLMLLAYCYMKSGDLEKYTQTTRKELLVTNIIDNYLLITYLNTIIYLKSCGKLNTFCINDFINNKEFESEEAKDLVSTIVSLFLGDNSPELIQRLINHSIFFNQNIEILKLIANSFYLIRQDEKAVKIYRLFIDTNQESRELFFYIYALFNTKKESQELLLHFSNWRLNFTFQSEFLKAELDMRAKLLDWNTCIEICEYYLSQKPKDEEILVNYAIALYYENSEKSNQALLRMVVIFKDFEYKLLACVANIATVLIKRKYFDEGLELLYRYAKSKDNKELRTQYFYACVECSQNDQKSPLKELDEAVEGTFIKYQLNDNVFFIELSEDNLKLEFHNAFLGVKTGATIVVKRQITDIEDHFFIQRIMNKYLALHDEILEQVTHDPHSGIGLASITFKGGDIDSLTETLKSLFGSKGTIAKETSKEIFEKYYSFQLTYSQVVYALFKGDYLGGYHYMIEQRGLAIIPIVSLRTQIEIDTEFVLDITSLVIIFQLIKKYQIVFDTKFIISKYVVDYLKKQYESQNQDSKTNISLTITENSVIPHFAPENYKEKNKEYLNGLLDWIDNNCEIIISNRLLDFSRNIEVNNDKQPFIDYVLNTVLLLEDNPKRILITDDNQYIKSGFVPFDKIATSEYFTKSFIGEEHPAMFDFIINKYRGFSLSLTQINNEYNKKLALNFNYYDNCLENINLIVNPNSLIPVILHIKEIALNQLVSLEQFKSDITNVFVNLMRGVDPSIRAEVELLIKFECSIIVDRYELIIESLIEAYKLLDYK